MSSTIAEHGAEKALGADLLGALEQLPLPTTVISRIGTLVWQNRAGIETFGHTVGRSLTRYVAPDDRARAVAAFGRVLAGGSISEAIEALDAAGRLIPLEVVAAPLLERGRVAGALVIAVPARLRPDAPTGRGAPRLTPRQLQTLHLLGDGRSTREVADTLGVTVETARNHVRALLRRLAVHSRLAAVAEGHRLGLL